MLKKLYGCDLCFRELGIQLEQVLMIWCDNIRASLLASNLVFQARTKHIEFDVHFDRESFGQVVGSSFC